MLRRMIVLTVLVAAFATGCGRAKYDEKVDSAIQNAKSPPAAEPDAAERDAGKEGEPKGDAPMGNG